MTTISEDEQFKKIVIESESIAQVLQKLNMKTSRGNYSYFYNRVNLLSISIDHFTGKLWNKNKITGQVPHSKKSITELLVKNSHVTTSSLSKRLVKEKLLKNECSVCFLKEWQKKAITFHLDHIDR